MEPSPRPPVTVEPRGRRAALTVRTTLAALLSLTLLAAACSGGDPDVAEDLVSVGTEAWTGTAAPSEAPEDPTGQNPVLPSSGGDLPLVPPEATVPAVEDPGAADGAASGTGEATGPVPAGPGGLLPVDQGVEAVLAAMSIEQRVGQLFAVSLVGDDATSPSPAAASANTQLYGFAAPADVVAAYHLGGVAYLDHDLGAGTSNVDDVVGVAALSAGLQQAAAADTGVGLLIGADQEGGNVVRLRAPATVFPAARRVGDTGDLALAGRVGQVMGAEAAAVGIRWVFSPVADVNVNPANPVIGDRAFATTSDRVVPLVQAAAGGLAQAGVLPTLKHFPGHGDTSVDSHSSLPTIDHDLATLEQVDLPPFAVAGSLGAPVSVMTGHLAVPALDPTGTPATLSAPILQVLREDLGFDGVVVTDAMNMGALDGFGGPGVLAVQAIAAGNDVVLMPTDLPAAYDAVLAAVADGTLPLARVDEAVRRVLTAKAELGLLDAAAIPPGDPTLLGAPAHTAVREDLRAACGC